MRSAVVFMYTTVYPDWLLVL